MNHPPAVKTNFIITATAIVLTICAGYSSAQQEGDRIIAIVGNDIISESDLNSQLYVYAKQNNIGQLTDKVVQQVFQNMIAEKLMIAKADQDSIIVTDDEAQKQIDARIQQLLQQFGSEKNLEQAYGLTMAKIKNILKEDMKKRMKIEKLKQRHFGGGIHVTRTEVLEFFQQYKDSLPQVPETFELFQIVKTPGLSEASKKLAYEKAKSLLDSVRSGADFSDIAKKYSEDSASAAKGGDLGKVKKGILVKEFEDAAYLLKPGEISDLVETQFGYHIIKVYERTGDVIKVQHILVKFPKLESEDFEAINFLRELKSNAGNSEKLFKDMAASKSDDKQAAADSGFIGKVSINQLDSLELIALRDLKKNDISEPVRVGDERDYSYIIFYVKERYAEHKATLEQDYSLIENLALNYKENKKMNEWLDELKKTIYVEIKI